MDKILIVFNSFLNFTVPFTITLNSISALDDLPKQKQQSVLYFTPMDASLPYSFSFLLG